MRMTLRRLREQKGLKLETASKLFKIDVNTLKKYEEYKEIPSRDELVTMLKIMGFYFDEVITIIYNDIEEKYNKNRYYGGNGNGK